MMNRMEEYEALQRQLAQVPPSDCVSRAISRRRKRRVLGRSLGTLAAVFCLFVGIINVSPTAAAACSRIPVLQELTELLIFRPSIRMAVEHDYLQILDQTQTRGEITASVEYLVVDQKQVNLYYRLRSDRYEALSANPEVLDADGSRVHASISHGGLYEENGELREITVDFLENNVPDTLVLELEVYDNGRFAEDAPLQQPEDPEPAEPEILVKFQFTLNFDPFYTAQGEQLTLNRQADLDGQTITVTALEIYPTHIRIAVREDPENTAELTALRFRLKLDSGETVETIQNGITATGTAEDPLTTWYRAESSYFKTGRPVEMEITGTDFLDRDREAVTLNLKTLEHDPLPEGVRLTEVEKIGSEWAVHFGIQKTEESHAQLLQSAFEDGAGNALEICRSSYLMELYDAQGEPIEGWEEEVYYLDGVQTDQVTLHLHHNRYWKPEQPVSVDLR